MVSRQPWGQVEKDWPSKECDHSWHRPEIPPGVLQTVSREPDQHAQVQGKVSISRPEATEVEVTLGSDILWLLRSTLQEEISLRICVEKGELSRCHDEQDREFWDKIIPPKWILARLHESHQERSDRVNFMWNKLHVQNYLKCPLTVAHHRVRTKNNLNFLDITSDRWENILRKIDAWPQAAGLDPRGQHSFVFTNIATASLEFEWVYQPPDCEQTTPRRSSLRYLDDPFIVGDRRPRETVRVQGHCWITRGPSSLASLCTDTVARILQTRGLVLGDLQVAGSVRWGQNISQELAAYLNIPPQLSLPIAVRIVSHPTECSAPEESVGGQYLQTLYM